MVSPDPDPLMRSHILAATIKMAGASNRRRATLLLVVLLSAAPLGAKDKNKRSASRSADEECVHNLQRIYISIKQYLHHSGGRLGFPADLEALYPMAREPKPFVCPADKEPGSTRSSDSIRTSYEIVGNPLDRIPPNEIAIVVEKRANHAGRRFVLFYDGSVRAFNDAQYDKLKSNLFIDEGSDIRR